MALRQGLSGERLLPLALAQSLHGLGQLGNELLLLAPLALQPIQDGTRSQRQRPQQGE